MREILELSQSTLPGLVLAGQGAPKSVSVLHYGPDGAGVASTGQAQYGQGSDGRGQLSYVSRRAGGAPYAKSQLTLDGGGRPLSASTVLQNPDGSPRKLLATAYDGLVFNAAGGVSGGSAAFTVSDPDGAPTHQAKLSYADERFDSYQIQAVPAVAGTAAPATRVNFAAATVVGNRLMGGRLELTHCRDGVTPSTQSSSMLNGLGLPDLVSVTNLAGDGRTPRQRVRSDYSGVAFSPLGKIDHGSLVVTTEAADGNGGSSTVFRFAGGQMVGKSGWVSGQLIEPIEQAPSSSVPVPWAPTRPADRTSTRQRPDGTLLEQRQDWYRTPVAPAPMPYRSRVTRYAIDGKTAVRLTDIDYRAAQCDPTGRPVGGTVISTRYEAGIRASTTYISY